MTDRERIMTRKERPFVSVIVPLYNEEKVINEMYSKLLSVLDENKLGFEIIMVNDGSGDDTLEIAKNLCQKSKDVKLISFSRNFGHQVAVSAGLDKSAGEVVVIIDADLQDPPEIIAEMIAKWREGYDVVYGLRKKRKGESRFKLATAALFYRLIRKMTPIEIPVDAGDFRLMDRRVVEELRKMREKSRFVRGLVSWVGFKQCSVEYIRERRFAGETKYPLKKMMRLALDGILSFSHVPLKLSSAFGFLCSGISFVFILYGLLVKFFFPGLSVSGWASIFVGTLFLGGVQLICIGILGEYIGRIYDEIKSRPLYIVEEEVNFE